MLPMKLFIIWAVLQLVMFCVTAALWLSKLTELPSSKKTGLVIASITLQSFAIATLFISLVWFILIHGITVIKWFDYLCIILVFGFSYSAIGVQFAIFPLLEAEGLIGLPLTNFLVPVGICALYYFVDKFSG